MKKFLALAVLLLVFLLSACGGAATPSSTESISAIYTAAALTITAQAGSFTSTPATTPTPSPSPTNTPTPLPSATSFQGGLPTSSGQGTSLCNSSTYVSDVTIPDGTILAPGQAFVKTWSLQNSGTCSWTTSYSMTFVSGTAMGGNTTAINQSISPGAQGQVSVSMVAPTSVGNYTGYWRLATDGGSPFGQSVYVKIVVSTSAATLTSTPGTTTPTPTGSANKTATPTTAAASTNTSVPSTSTPTITLTSVPPTTEVPPSETPTVTVTPTQ